jgi:hypothetical protein
MRKSLITPGLGSGLQPQFNGLSERPEFHRICLWKRIEILPSFDLVVIESIGDSASIY